MVCLAKHKKPAPRLQYWQHKANFLAHIRHARLWLIETKEELLDAWHTYKAK